MAHLHLGQLAYRVVDTVRYQLKYKPQPFTKRKYEVEMRLGLKKNRAATWRIYVRLIR